MWMMSRKGLCVGRVVRTRRIWVDVGFGRPLTERICYVAEGRRLGGNLVARDRTRCTHWQKRISVEVSIVMHTVPEHRGCIYEPP